MRIRDKRPEPAPSAPSGLAGRDGVDGKDGRDGRDGVAGARGADGRDGADGRPGLTGRAGLAGKDGERGIQGKAGRRGESGLNGWSPILAVVEDGERRVHQVTDWTGGEGEKPESGWFVGPEGPVQTAREATDIRGPRGTAGAVGFIRNGSADGGGEPGPAGASAYQVALDNGFIGSEAEWLDSLVGPQGVMGPIGPTGPAGPTGSSCRTYAFFLAGV